MKLWLAQFTDQKYPLASVHIAAGTRIEASTILSTAVGFDVEVLEPRCVIAYFGERQDDSTGIIEASAIWRQRVIH